MEQTDEILVKEYRGGVLENVHRGRICGVGADKRVHIRVGDMDMPTFWRSCAKPIQAIPRVMRGIDERLSFSEAETAITLSSHRGEAGHIETLESLMQKSGLQEAMLVCGSAYPANSAARENLLKRQAPPRPIYHNCSGKHFGVLTLCKQMGWPLDSYWDISHPAQQEIIRMLLRMSECSPHEMHVATDGCGFPVTAMPLKNLATAYLKLACPELIEDEAVRAAVVNITNAMNREHWLVSGTGRITSVFLQDENIVAKDGAKGVYCFGLKREKLGFAFKVSDGSDQAWPYIITAILTQIGYANEKTIAELQKFAPPEIKNDNGKIVGEVQTVFRI